MNNKLKKELKTVFSSPIPTRKQEFLKDFPFPKARKFEFVMTQAGYIRKRFWCLSVLLLVVVVGIMKLYPINIMTIGLLSATLPFLSLLGIAEIQKSTSFNMAEMEMACRHNLVEVTLIRLSIIGSFHFISLSIFLMIASNWSEYGYLRTVLYSITPFLLCSYVSLYLLNRLKTRDILYICATVTGFVSLCTGLVINQFKGACIQKSIIYWIMAFMILTVLFVFEIKKTFKRMEELEWNLVLTA